MTTHTIHWTDFPLTYNLDEKEARELCDIDNNGFMVIVSNVENPLQYSICDFYCPSEKRNLTKSIKQFGIETSEYSTYSIETELINEINNTMKKAIIQSSDLQKFNTFSAHFFINTSKLTRETVYNLPEEEIDRLSKLLSSQPDIKSYLIAEVGHFESSREKKIQAISYFIDNKELFLEQKKEKFDQAKQRQEELLSLSEKVSLKKNTDIEPNR